METALETRALSKRYRRGRIAALENVSLAVPGGAFVALVGPNGAGKSTLVRTFLGFERPTAGSAEVLGIDVRRDTPRALAPLGYVGQTPGIYGVLTGAARSRWPRSCGRGSTPRAPAAAGGRRIPDDRPAGQLSGGQQAQLALTLALGTRAPVLLLDEPLASLDPLARREFLGTVAEAVAGGTTVLLRRTSWATSTRSATG